MQHNNDKLQAKNTYFHDHVSMLENNQGLSAPVLSVIEHNLDDCFSVHE